MKFLPSKEMLLPTAVLAIIVIAIVFRVAPARKLIAGM